MKHNANISLGVILDAPVAPAWIERLIALVRQTPGVELRLAILAGSAPDPAAPPGGLDFALYRFHAALERRMVRPEPDAFAPRDLGPQLAGVPRLDGRDGDIASQTAGYGLDVLLHLASAPPPGALRTAARCGLWALRHGDGREPAGLREVIEAHAVTESRLELLGVPPAPDLVISRTFTATAPLSVTRNRHNVFWKALHLVPRALATLARLGPERFREEVQHAKCRLKAELPNADSHSSIPRNREFLYPFVRQMARFGRARLRDRFSFDQWFLMAGPGEPQPPGDFSSFRKLTPPDGRFWADPFIIRRERKSFIFFEDFPLSTGKGVIAVITVGEDGRSEAPVIVLERPYHLSYPFVFEWGGEWWMIPETMGNNAVELYRCARWPDRWEFEKTLIPGIRAVDATLCRWNGRWWLFANVCESEEISDQDELFVFWADSPLAGRWTAHPRNPVVSDVRRARPAGRLFEHEGALYRPSQCSAPDYGAALNINRVLRLDEEAYEEETVKTIRPGWEAGLQGVHTYNGDGGVAVIDARRRRWKRC